ncbi:hypothetical protein [Yoonia maritima]|uniref:hypothetical protein n=1 Tax=Yoonia maritima TaxID=1435347 RepID=UPI0037367D56
MNKKNAGAEIPVELQDFSDDINRLAHDTQNGYSFAKVSFIYQRLRELGPFDPETISMDAIFALDMMQSAFVVEYARIFVGGTRKVSKSKVPAHLQKIHETIMDLRNKRYAHEDGHESVENFLELQILDDQIVVDTKANIGIALGAPPEWDALITWLGEYLFEQRKKQLQRLADVTGYKWNSRSEENSS